MLATREIILSTTLISSLVKKQSNATPNILYAIFRQISIKRREESDMACKNSPPCISNHHVLTTYHHHRNTSSYYSLLPYYNIHHYLLLRLKMSLLDCNLLVLLKKYEYEKKNDIEKERKVIL
jgi:hypothetical protein